MTISIEDRQQAAQRSDAAALRSLHFDLEEAATIDHIESIGARVRSNGLRSTAWAYEDIFDRGRLKAALIAAGALRVNEDIVEGAAEWICEAWIKIRIRKKSKPPSQKLLRLHKALSEWVGDQSWEAFELSLCLTVPGVDKRFHDAIGRLTKQVGQLIKERRAGRKGRQEEALTTFLARLYSLYIAVSGKTGLSDGCGPAYHFIQQCSALIDPTIVVPERARGAIQAKIARDRAECKK